MNDRAGLASLYKGDTALSALLLEAGSSYDAKAVRALLAGVLAAPAPRDPGEWLALVAPSIPVDLAAQLAALRSEVEADALSSAPGSTVAARLEALRAELRQQGVDGFLVPRADEHQGEYVAARAQRLAWLTGFTGSAGLAIVLPRTAAIFVDGRYTLQAEAEVDKDLFERRHVTESPPTEWVATKLQQNQVLGYDPWLHTIGEIERFRVASEKVGGSLKALAVNPIDSAWVGQPPPPLSPVVVQEQRFTGRSTEEKRRMLGEGLARDQIDAAIITAPDSIAWLLNIRGGDVPYTPLPLSFAVLNRDGAVELFIDRRKLTPQAVSHFGNSITVRDPTEFGPTLDRLAQERRSVQADPATAAAWVFERLQGSDARVQRAPDPCLVPKACKNVTELAGSRAAHRRDGVALAKFLAWLDREAPKGTISEIGASDRLEAFRREGDNFRDLSFPTISGFGPNGAIVHYRATAKTEKRLAPGSLYLVDSGAQYLDGTTDVTRTVAIGSPSSEMRDRFTRVLKGMIAVATCRFPKGTTGSQLDTLARIPLWRVGLDFDHGTGHGVGSFLAVHEGPQRISKVPNSQALLPGMIVSDEPGYYKAGAYGIRIENLVTVVSVAVAAGDRAMLAFDTLTLVPIDHALIERGLMSSDEIAWLDNYHAEVRTQISPLVDIETRQWLEQATRPVGS